ALNVTNATFDISGTTNQPTAGGLNLSDATLAITLANPGMAGAITTGTFTASGFVNNLRVTTLPLITSVPKQFTVIKYSTPPASTVLDTVALTLPTPQTPLGYLSNNTAAG